MIHFLFVLFKSILICDSIWLDIRIFGIDQVIRLCIHQQVLGCNSCQIQIVTLFSVLFSCNWKQRSSIDDILSIWCSSGKYLNVIISRIKWNESSAISFTSLSFYWLMKWKIVDNLCKIDGIIHIIHAIYSPSWQNDQ